MKDLGQLAINQVTCTVDSALSVCRAIEDHLLRKGLKFRTVSGGSISRWKKLSESVKLCSVQKLRILQMEVSDLERDKVDFKNSANHLCWFLDKYSLSVDPRFLKTIDNEDVVEVYNSSLEQTFRNFKLLEFTDYDLLELNTYDWPQLFYRSEKINEKLFDLAQKTLNSYAGFGKIDVVPHLMREQLSFSQKVVKVTQGYGGPVMYNGNVSGFVCSQKVSDSNITVM